MLKRTWFIAVLLASITLLVSCSSSQLSQIIEPSQASGRAWLASSDASSLSYSTTNEGQAAGADRTPYPLKAFDSNGNHQIDDSELIRILHAWTAGQVTDETILEALNLWLGQGIFVDEEENGQQVSLDRGQVLAIILESNPSTGYSWEVVESSDSVILRQMGDSKWQTSDHRTPPLIGAGGWEIFHFEAAMTGQAPLKLVYHRPWEQGVAPLETFTLRVTVR